ncbi:hypothetical protein ALC53_04604 [Atta colombica]|uniref:Secreted protein n=1 Tax=Atta colombica TaxID=520822 RepID=A0A195BJJ7_9HYME|nr:hypothetical protein ALC53_04604 [Atta colombica]
MVVIVVRSALASLFVSLLAFVEGSSDGAMVSSNHNPKIGSLSSSADIINLIDSMHLLLKDAFVLFSIAISSTDVSKDCPVHSARIGSNSCFVVKTVDAVSPDCVCCCGNLSTRYASSTLHA